MPGGFREVRSRALKALNPWLYGNSFPALNNITSGLNLGCNTDESSTDIGWDFVCSTRLVTSLSTMDECGHPSSVSERVTSSQCRQRSQPMIDSLLGAIAPHVKCQFRTRQRKIRSKPTTEVVRLDALWHMMHPMVSINLYLSRSRELGGLILGQEIQT